VYKNLELLNKKITSGKNYLCTQKKCLYIVIVIVVANS